MGNKLRHEGDEVRIKVIWPDVLPSSSTLWRVEGYFLSMDDFQGRAISWVSWGDGKSNHGDLTFLVISSFFEAF